MSIEVSDKISNLNDNLVNAASVLRNSKQARKVFEEIYRGKRRTKSKREIESITGLSEVRVLQLGQTLVANEMVNAFKADGQMVFEKVKFYSHHKEKILRLASDKKRLNAIPTKVKPKVTTGTSITVVYPSKLFEISEITIDDIDSFSAVRKVVGVAPY